MAVEWRFMWDEIRMLAPLIGSDSWILLGDFNECLHINDRQGLRERSDLGPFEFR